MKKHLLNIAFVVSLAQVGLAQTAPEMSWRRHLNGSDKGMIESIDTLSNGNYVMAGVKYNLDPNNKDMLIAVTDRHSQKIWSKVIAGEKSEFLKSVKEDNDGNLIAVGDTWSVTDGVFGTSKGNSDAVVMKLDAEDGSIIWTKRFGGSLSDYAYDVIITSDGNYLIAGHTGSNDGDISSNAGLNDAWILKVDTDGNLLSEKTYGTIGHEYAYKIQETSDGGFVFFGESRTNAKMPDGEGASFDMLVVKVDKNGDEDFNLIIGGSLDDNLYYGTKTSDGGYIIAGTSKSNDGDFTNVSQEDGFVVKIKSNGTIDWKKSFASGNDMEDRCKVVKETKDNGFIVLSTYEHKLSIYASLNITKLNSSGTEAWTKTLSGRSNPYAYEIKDGILTADGGYLAVGGTAPDQTETFYSSYTATLVKFGGTDNPAFTSIWPSKAMMKSVSVYPNPAVSEINISVTTPSEIKIVSILGETVLTGSLQAGTNLLNISAIAPGVYQLISNNGDSVKLIIAD
jgi:hypothetical protein